MPSETFSMTLAVSVLAGIISGLCYVIVTRRKHFKRTRQWNCTVCGQHFRSIGFVLGAYEFVNCNECETNICKAKCSVSISENIILCRICNQKEQSWTDLVLRTSKHSPKHPQRKMVVVDSLSNELKEDLIAEDEVAKGKIRDFIEELVNNLLGQNIDDACVNKIYNDTNYLPIIGESPCTANSALRLIIEKIIREANDLPKLKTDKTSVTIEENNRSYEDLLSAAILNKIISNSQNHINPESCSSRAESISSHVSSSSRRKNHQKEYFFGEETLENKWKNIDTDTASISSLEEWVHSDSSLGPAKYVDRISLTIKQRIEEVTSSDSDENEEGPDEKDDANYFRSDSSFTNNEANWFLQRRQFRGGTISPIPVPMLVPNPTGEAKVLIGDKEVDDTSDLSDVPSDFEDENQDAMAIMDVKSHLVGAKSIIGGKNPLMDFSHMLSDDDVSADSGVKECKDLDEMDTEMFFFSNDQKLNDLADASSIHSEGSNNERDTEYTERYATLPRQILMPQKNTRPKGSFPDKKAENYHTITSEAPKEDNEYEFPGLYSQREKQKWKHAVELENNPYSKENIEKRIKSKNTINSLFGNDYYIKQASLPSGSRTSETSKEATSTSEKQSWIKSGQEQLSNENSNPLERPITTKGFTLAYEMFKSSENVQEISDSELHFSSELNSDSDVSLVNCYNISQSVIYKKLCADKEEIQSAEKFLESESLEDSSNLTKEQFKPVAKPRKRLKSEKKIEELTRLPNDSRSIRLCKNENDEEFKSIPYSINRKPDNTSIKTNYLNCDNKLLACNNVSKRSISIEKPSVKKPVEYNTESMEENRKEHINNEDIPPKHRLFTSTPIRDNISQIPDMLWKNIHIDSNGKMNGGDAFENSKSENLAQHYKNNNFGCDEALEEISKLKQQQLVANRLKEFSKSSGNLLEICEDYMPENVVLSLHREKNLSTRSEDRYVRRKSFGLQKNEQSASVKDLRKIFEQFDVSKQEEKPILYSLTGRSISKQIKEKLRDINEQTSLSQIQSLSLTDLEVIENTKQFNTKSKEN